MQKTLYITILILISKEAYAYLDPGSTTLIDIINEIPNIKLIIRLRPKKN